MAIQMFRYTLFAQIFLPNLHLERDFTSNTNSYWSMRFRRRLHHNELEAVQSLVGDMAGLRFLYAR